MFYVSSYKDNIIGVTDTRDNVEEFYTKEELKTFNVEIIRFNKELPLGYKFETKCFNFELIEIDGTKGWKLKYKEGNNVFQNNPYLLGVSDN